MKIKTNGAFEILKQEFLISKLSEINVNLPVEVQEILNEPIAENEFGVSLNFWIERLHEPPEWENSSIVEDNANHFHVDAFAIPKTEETAFKLGIKTIFLLSEKFIDEGWKNMVFSYSFHTKAMAEVFDLENNLELSQKYKYGDRLSFHRLRDGETIFGDLNEFKGNAMLIIEI